MIISIIILILIIVLSFSKCNSNNKFNLKCTEHFDTNNDINTRVNELYDNYSKALLVKTEFDNFKTANDSRLNMVVI